MLKHYWQVWARGRLTLGGARQWHWVSSALCLMALIGFAVTGITLNHAQLIEGEARVEERVLQVPTDRLEALRVGAEADDVLPAEFRRWLWQEHRLRVPARAAQWSDWDVYVPLSRPGGEAWLSVDLDSGELVYERVDRGWVAFANDLHKGRNTGPAWSLMMDVFAVACLIFALTGLVLLYRHAAYRPTTWPLVGLGVVLPALLLMLWIH